MCFPRELSLRRTDRGWRLYQQPVRELRERLQPCDSLPSGTSVIEIELGEEISCLALKNDRNRLILTVDPVQRRITLDRSECGGAELGGFFTKPRSINYEQDCQKLLLLLDNGSVEVFAADGASCGTMQYISNKPFSVLEASHGIRQVRYYEILSKS